MDIKNFIDDVLSTMLFTKKALEGYYHPGECDLVIVTGDNASGKSLIRRLFTLFLTDLKVEGIHLSMEGRTSGGIERAMIYGSEQDEATGSITSNSILGAIRTSKIRTKDNAIIWDEPELGLSDNYCASAGQTIRNFLLNERPEFFKFATIITHSKILVSQLIDLKPHHISMGVDETLEDWFYAPVIPQPLETIKKNNLERWRKIHKILEDNKKKKNEKQR